MTKQPQSPTEFDRYAADYDRLIEDPLRESFASGRDFFLERKLDVIRRFFRARGASTLSMDWLDVGCGQGDLLRMGRAHFASVAGCDPSAGMLQACSGLDVRQQASSETLPFPDSRFDFVTAVCVYHHVDPGLRQALTAEMLRVLRPGGVLAVIEHNPFNPVTRLIVARSPVDAQARLLTAAQTRRLLDKAGAAIVDTRYFLLFPQRAFRYAAPIETALERIPAGGQYAVFGRRVVSSEAERSP